MNQQTIERSPPRRMDGRVDVRVTAHRGHPLGVPRGAREAARSLSTKDVSLIREQGQFVRVTKNVSGIPDREDAAFCECAESANADFIVTLNPADFPQNKLKKKVIAPSDPFPARGRKPRASPQASCDPQEVASTVNRLGPRRALR